MTVSAVNRGVVPRRNPGLQAEHVEQESGDSVEDVKMRNNWFTSVVALLIWLVIVVMNVALLVLVGMHKA